MKIYILLITLVLIISNICFAQSSTDDSIASRLIAITRYSDVDSSFARYKKCDTGVTPMDSSVYTYAGINSGALSQTIKYTKQTVYDYDLKQKIYNIGETTLHTFDNNDNNDTEIFWRWNRSSKQYEGSYKNIYIYGPHNNNVEQIKFVWDSTTLGCSLRNSERRVDRFDIANNNTFTEEFDWSKIKRKWVPFRKEWQTYDSHNNVICVDDISTNIKETHLDTKKHYKYQFIYSYNSKGKDSSEIYLDFFGGSIGQTIYRTLKFYDANNNDTLNITQDWNPASPNWRDNSYTSYRYDKNNNAIFERAKQVYRSTSKLVTISETYSTFNSFNQEISRTTKYFNQDLGISDVIHLNGVIHYYYETYTLNRKSKK